MIVVVTGMVGVDKKSYLERVCQFAAQKGKELLLCKDIIARAQGAANLIVSTHATFRWRHGLPFVEATALGRKIRLDLREVQQIERDINSQIYARDFLLIDQSDMIISSIPSLPDGRAAISSGVERELQHAHEAAKEVYVIWQRQGLHKKLCFDLKL